jgi:hypothetical protein
MRAHRPERQVLQPLSSFVVAHLSVCSFYRLREPIRFVVGFIREIKGLKGKRTFVLAEGEARNRELDFPLARESKWEWTSAHANLSLPSDRA